MSSSMTMQCSDSGNCLCACIDLSNPDPQLIATLQAILAVLASPPAPAPAPGPTPTGAHAATAKR